MRKIAFSLVFSILLFCCARDACGQQKLEHASICDIKNDPAAYNHKLLEITDFVSHGFEDFTFFDPDCTVGSEIWLDYGGMVKSGTMYCCGVTADRHRPKEFKVENVSVPLVENKPFHEFDKLIQPPFKSGKYGSIVHATLVGRFFAGRIDALHAISGGGYGHMGCCSLFAIQEVKSVDGQDRNDLDYGGSFDQPEDCVYESLRPFDLTKRILKAQQEADQGQRDWVFNDPSKVAVSALAQLARINERTISKLKKKRIGQGRIVYEWKPIDRNGSYMVVVSRPYWLSFYAQNSKRVAWVVEDVFRSSCGSN